jgi:hypothetical protein
VNPNNLKPDINGIFPEEVYSKVPDMLKILSLCWLILSLISLILFQPYVEPVSSSSGRASPGASSEMNLTSPE